MNDQTTLNPAAGTTTEAYVQEVLNDYRLGILSREVSLLGRREVLGGKAKFGIVGDGKELPQLAMARVFRPGDFRAGYYRDQTFMFAAGLSSVEDFFAQLYADADNDPFSHGRQMNAHFATPLLDAQGRWLPQRELKNVSADISPTAGQMARALGLALASKTYRNNPALQDTPFSDKGNEVCFCTIGDASTSEGIFWETMNAAAVMQVPLAVSVWDDGYGISVPIDYQTVKKSISQALAGFQSEDDGDNGIDIYTVKAWDYPALCRTYEQAIQRSRETHRPCLIHVQEVTQPQGHSTSGSHERYKSPERLQWESDRDGLGIMRNWLIETGMASAEALDDLEKAARQVAREAKNAAWKAYNAPIIAELQALLGLFDQIIAAHTGDSAPLLALRQSLASAYNPSLKDLVKHARQMAFACLGQQGEALGQLDRWIQRAFDSAHERYHTHLYSETERSALQVPIVPPRYEEDAEQKNGYEILNQFFDHILGTRPEVYAFGEDVGQIGDVNQGFAGLQDKHGIARVFDTGIREWSIMGQAIGMAMRGLRPIAEIQYLDYLLYGLPALSDDLATLRYRSNGIQAAPAIIRTRGHRLEGIWHAGSPIGMILGSLRGIHVLVPRNMVQAAGLYNTILQSDDPALLIECLNGYRLKERVPSNLGQYTVPLGVPEILREGSDATLVSYGSSLRIAEEGCDLLAQKGISVELIDVQTLLPFDLEKRILRSLQKTNRIVFMDEDVPGGATAYMMQEVLEKQGGYRWLDSAPLTLSAQAHRPPYGSDGDYFSKPNAEDVFEAVYGLMREAQPQRFA